MARLRDLLKIRRTRDRTFVLRDGQTFRSEASKHRNLRGCMDDRTQSLHWDLRPKPGRLNLPMRWRI
jgi:hypothetical protein